VRHVVKRCGEPLNLGQPEMKYINGGDNRLDLIPKDRLD
jgi:hypothetical protein